MNATPSRPFPLQPWLRLGVALALALLAAPRSPAQAVAPAAPLGNTTIYIIRHAEKPDEGPELTAAGEKRAEAYVDYFSRLRVDKQPVKIEHLFATADSKNSARPRLTLTPLSHALKLPIDLRFDPEDFQKLAEEIHAHDHGRCIVICWHHGTIPGLLAELGMEPARLLPGGEWPKDVFNWVLELRYDAEGKLRPKHSSRTVMRWSGN